MIKAVSGAGVTGVIARAGKGGPVDVVGPVGAGAKRGACRGRPGPRLVQAPGERFNNMFSVRFFKLITEMLPSIRSSYV